MSLFFCEVVDDDDYYDVIAYHLAKNHRPQLEGMLHLLSPKRLRAAIFGIGLLRSTGSDEVLRTYLDHSDPLVVSAALDALRGTGTVEWEHVSRFLTDTSPFVRGAALRLAKARLGTNALPLLLAALKDSAAIVKQNALDELDGIADKSHLAPISLLLQDPSAHVRQAAKTLIEAIG